MTDDEEAIRRWWDQAKERRDQFLPRMTLPNRHRASLEAATVGDS